MRIEYENDGGWSEVFAAGKEADPASYVQDFARSFQQELSERVHKTTDLLQNILAQQVYPKLEL